jgi:hypothetical protein
MGDRTRRLCEVGYFFFLAGEAFLAWEAMPCVVFSSRPTPSFTFHKARATPLCLHYAWARSLRRSHLRCAEITSFAFYGGVIRRA